MMTQWRRYKACGVSDEVEQAAQEIIVQNKSSVAAIAELARDPRTLILQ